MGRSVPSMMSTSLISGRRARTASSWRLRRAGSSACMRVCKSGSRWAARWRGWPARVCLASSCASTRAKRFSRVRKYAPVQAGQGAHPSIRQQGFLNRNHARLLTKSIFPPLLPIKSSDCPSKWRVFLSSNVDACTVRSCLDHLISLPRAHENPAARNGSSSLLRAL